jgi:hypothetical protein
VWAGFQAGTWPRCLSFQAEAQSLFVKNYKKRD